MSTDVVLTLVAVACAIISITCFDLTRRALKRRERDRARAQEAAEEVRDRVAVALAAAVGQVPIRQCHVEDIKYGETMCWRSKDWEEHTDYVAGYDGDPGPSPDGFHGKPIVLKGEAL